MIGLATRVLSYRVFYFTLYSLGLRLGEGRPILAARHQTYLLARERNPRRWSRHTRDWSHIGVVTLNPERDTVVNAALHAEDIELVA